MLVNPMRSATLAVSLLFTTAASAQAQAPAAGATTQTATPHQSGTVKAVTTQDFVLTSAAGQDYSVTVPGSARILLVPPGSRDLSAAQPGTMADIAVGDRAIVNGTAGDSGSTLNAARVIVMKSSAIAASHAADQAAWASGAGGIVRSVDSGGGTVTLSSGLRSITVQTTPNTIVRRYAGTSVRFEDAVKSTVAAIQPGDQLRARGQRSVDGSSIVADEVVTGSFSNFSGVISAVNTAQGTVTLKDLATKRSVTVAVTDASNLRRLPAGMGQMGAGRAGAGTGAGAGAGAGTAQGGQGGQRPASGGDAATGERGGADAGAGGGAGRTGMDLSRMMNRLPTQTLADLKPGDAVMIVAANNAQAGSPTAITLLAGVEQILAAHPSGETTLSPWSLGGGGGEGDAGGGGGGGGGSR